MLVAGRLTGDGMWFRRARELADRSVATVGTKWSIPSSLYKGDVGIALLAHDLSTAHDSSTSSGSMPLFAGEGWGSGRGWGSGEGSGSAPAARTGGR